jgi:transcriptional repressor NrdR
MQCPFCKEVDTRVVDSRIAEDGSQVRRRRECPSCGARFTTFERAHLPIPAIRKQDGKVEAFDEEKLTRGMQRALYKRAVSDEAVRHAVENIIRKLRATGERDVPAMQVGEWVMEELRELDHVAFVRFASVYRSFEDVQAFREEIERLERMPSAALRASQLPLINLPRVADDTAKPEPAKR